MRPILSSLHALALGGGGGVAGAFPPWRISNTMASSSQFPSAEFDDIRAVVRPWALSFSVAW
jgi:hypothetical protein